MGIGAIDQVPHASLERSLQLQIWGRRHRSIGTKEQELFSEGCIP